MNFIRPVLIAGLFFVPTRHDGLRCFFLSFRNPSGHCARAAGNCACVPCNPAGACAASGKKYVCPYFLHLQGTKEGFGIHGFNSLPYALRAAESSHRKPNKELNVLSVFSAPKWPQRDMMPTTSYPHSAVE